MEIQVMSLSLPMPSVKADLRTAGVRYANRIPLIQILQFADAHLYPVRLEAQLPLLSHSARNNRAMNARTFTMGGQDQKSSILFSMMPHQK